MFPLMFQFPIYCQFYTVRYYMNTRTKMHSMNLKSH